ncbi:YcnI family protein [Microbacterium album]|uniref:YncI copper-binding domain-containing protein n=1 Tax=Microbacterium album TaxID=2053191 RepID=A0A917IH88_9MICO|nr:YcnI family protein [Microbacterium album]GGH46719.1 hypothetical protein GCM10010921_23010 [Microbacterium album]
MLHITTAHPTPRRSWAPAVARRSRRHGARRIAGAAATATLAAGFVLLTPGAATAHVTVTPDSPTAGGYDVLTFAFSHGCSGSPTTALHIDIPDGLDSVSPTVQPGWEIEVERDPGNGLVTSVVYTTDDPVPDHLRATVTLGVKYAADAPTVLAFPVEQVCAEGATSWSQIADEGQDPHDLDHPAPFVTLAEPVETAGTGADGDDGTSAMPVALGAGGLLTGVAALAVSVLAWRRSGRA